MPTIGTSSLRISGPRVWGNLGKKFFNEIGVPVTKPARSTKGSYAIDASEVAGITTSFGFNLIGLNKFRRAEP